MTQISPTTLKMLRCPVTKSELTVASEAEVADLNAKIAAGDVVNQMGQSVNDPVDGVLINAEGNIGCAVRRGIIQMIADEALVIPQKDERTLT